VGFIWQQTSRNLLPYLTAAQNVDLPMRLAGSGKKARQARTDELLDRAGRLQLPRDMTETLGMRDRVRLELEPDHIGVWPDRRASGAADPGPAGSPEADT
jgi:ABC-type nitrate/sulfonate/bicarbonate transport system ATPase subunit